MADTYSEIKALIVDLLGVEESKVTMDARFAKTWRPIRST